MKIKTGDTVKVITGHYKGTISEVKAVFPKTNKRKFLACSLRPTRPPRADMEAQDWAWRSLADLSN